jgi:O-antigen ligase
VIRAALITQLVLVTFAMVFPRVAAAMPTVGPAGPDSQVLSPRADLNCALLAVLAMSSAVRLLRRRGTWLPVVVNLTLIVWSIGVALRIASRSGLIALVACFLIVLAVELRPAVRQIWMPMRIVVAVMLVTVVAVGAPRLGVFHRLGDTAAALGVGGDATKPVSLATGTAQARIASWKASLRYTNRTPSRQVVGVGFGPDFLHDAGAAAILEGSVYTGVRAPHNYLINTYARLGGVGLLVVIVGIASVLGAAIRMLPRRREFDMTLTLLFVSLLVVAIFGVILESPFGAVPAFWAAGWLLSNRAARKSEAATWSDAAPADESQPSIGRSAGG